MSYYKTCPICGAHLDPGESCDCERDVFCITAGCGHEVYEGESLFAWDGKCICPDCMRAELLNLPTEELVLLLGGSVSLVMKEA